MAEAVLLRYPVPDGSGRMTSRTRPGADVEAWIGQGTRLSSTADDLETTRVVGPGSLRRDSWDCQSLNGQGEWWRSDTVRELSISWCLARVPRRRGFEAVVWRQTTSSWYWGCGWE